METDTPLKRWRTASKLSPVEAAARFDVSLPTWSRWENNKRDIPATRCVALSNETGIALHELRPDVFPAPASEGAAA